MRTAQKLILIAALFLLRDELSIAEETKLSKPKAPTMSASTEKTPLWDMNVLKASPAATAAPGYQTDGATAVLIDGPSYRGRPTKFFAWYGVPKLAAGAKAPGIVLVHGGGGTAFVEWVKLWTDRGYAAIALDTNATMPAHGPHEPIANPQGGPKGSDHCFNQLDEPLTDQWAYHGVANIILANSFLRALPGVDADRIGITGISWGGYLTSIAIGIDDRFKFAVPVYGCGYLIEDSAWTSRFDGLGPEKTDRWRANWDPARYLPDAQMPIFWLNGDADTAFSLKIIRLSALAARDSDRYLSIQPGLGHGHSIGQQAPEVIAFADQVVRGGRPLARSTGQGWHGDRAWARFDNAGKVAARCGYTRGSGPWLKRTWTVLPAEWKPEHGEASVSLPHDATAYYFVITDNRGVQTSSLPGERE